MLFCCVSPASCSIPARFPRYPVPTDIAEFLAEIPLKTLFTVFLSLALKDWPLSDWLVSAVPSGRAPFLADWTLFGLSQPLVFSVLSVY